MTSPTPTYKVLTPELISQIDDYLYQIKENIGWGDVIVRMLKREIQFVIPAPSIPSRDKTDQDVQPATFKP